MTNNVKTRANRAKATAARKIGDGAARIRKSASATARKTSDAAEKAYVAARETTGKTVRKHPFAAIFGGLAVGALLGALLPRSKKEKELLGKPAAKLKENARKSAGAKLDELGITPEAAREKVGELIDKAASAIGAKSETPAKPQSKAKTKARAKTSASKTKA